ncbi:aldehyde dehydrogenase domain-containing protein [Myxozyma melibiosi]|uniref:Aldehyde dehydrogenase domain-containing protein n=1 Tax=Myxozyma melibiosi TaxID=54550 RepID=A0ABR1F575_9ASCO
MATKPTIVPLYINGKHIVSSSTAAARRLVPVISSSRIAKGQDGVVHHAQGATVEQALEAAKAAKAAFPAWRKSSVEDRRDILRGAADLLEKRREEGIEISMLESCPEKNYATFIYDMTVAHVKEWSTALASALRPTIPVSDEHGCFPIIFREPVGPVLGIAPWNAPSILAMRSFAIPIAAGCPTVFKTSELSPATHMHVAQSLIDAGLPAGVLNVVHSRFEDSADIVSSLISSPEIRKVNFTGSTALGRQLGVEAARNLKPILLELGGKASVIVLEDADLAEAAKQILIGAWMNQGQICMSTERVFVQSSVYDKLIDQIKITAKQLEPAFGGYPQAAERYAKRINGMVRNAVNEGAELVHGNLDLLTGTTLTPTVLTNVNPKSEIYTDETFGPTVYIQKMDTVQEMIDATNASDYGLTAGLWTKDMVRGLKIARQIDSGAVHINGMTVHDGPTLPHGGVKNSGIGRFGAEWGIQEFTQTKTVRMNGFDSAVF